MVSGEMSIGGHWRPRAFSKALLLVTLSLCAACCDRAGEPGPSSVATASRPPLTSPEQATPVPMDTPHFAELRSGMVEKQLAGRDIRDSRVLAAMGKVPRHLFVPQSVISRAYADYPLPIGHRQSCETIPSPVAAQSRR